MNDDQLDDLKQFITSTISQAVVGSEDRLTKRIDGLEGRIGGLEQKIDDLDTKVDTIAEALNDNHLNLETRVTKLESV